MKVCKNCGKCGPHCLAKWLLIVGGLNWGLIGLFEYDLVTSLLGSWPWLVKLIFVLVGLAAVMALIEKGCKHCKK